MNERYESGSGIDFQYELMYYYGYKCKLNHCLMIVAYIFLYFFCGIFS